MFVNKSVCLMLLFASCLLSVHLVLFCVSTRNHKSYRKKDLEVFKFSGI